MRSKILAVVAATSIGALTLSGPGTSAAGAAPVAQKASGASSIVWKTCADEDLRDFGAKCATVSVPLDWGKPRGKKIKIAISRVKHTVSASKYQGVMLVNPGGPGGSGLGLSFLGQIIPNYKGKSVGGAYDWIGFDPRGVGASGPSVSCDPKYAGYDRPKYDPDSTVSYKTYKLTDPWPAKTNAYTKACKAKNSSSLLRHLTTKDVAKDMDRIRQRLGAGKINYYGFSYGTYLGQVYATMFPQRTRRMVFDGTVDPRGVWYKANLSQDVAFDRNINIWFGWLAKHDDVYKLGNTKSKVRKLFYDTRDALYASPVNAPGGKLGGSEWIDAFLYAGYYQSTWTDLGGVFSAYIKSNDVAGLENAYLDASGYGDDNGYAVYLGVQCTDVAWPKSWTKWKKDNDKINKVAPFETWSNAWYNEPCRHWPAPSRKPVKINGKKVKSLLMINETLDAATPYPGSIQVRKRFPKASLIAVLGGTTHSNSLAGNPCVDMRIAHYLYDGHVPKRLKGNRADKKCKALPQPTPSPAAARTQQAPSFSNSWRLEVQKITAPR